MNSSGYLVILCGVLLANIPFLGQRSFWWGKARATLPARLLALLACFGLWLALSYGLEARVGQVKSQAWQFYVTLACLFLVAAFPGFVWRYLWRGHDVLRQPPKPDRAVPLGADQAHSPDTSS